MANCKRQLAIVAATAVAREHALEDQIKERILRQGDKPSVSHCTANLCDVDKPRNEESIDNGAPCETP